MGPTSNRPYAMNVANPPRTRLMSTKLYSPRHDVKYSREDHDQRQAEGSKRRELPFDSGHRRHDQADASKKLTDPDEDEQVLLTPSPPGQRQAPVSGSPAKRIREKNLEFHRFLLLCSFARVPAGAFLFNLI